MGAGVCAYRELIAITQCVFDILLVGGIFDGREALLGFHPGFGRVAEVGVGIGGGYVVTEPAEFIGVEAGVVGHRWGEAEMQPEVVGEVRRAAVDRPVGEIADASASTSLYMRVGRVACELDINEKAVSAEELGCGVEGVVDRVLGVPHEPLEVGGGDILTLREVGPHCEDRDVFAGRETVAADFVCGATRVVRRNPGDAAVDRGLVAVELARGAGLVGWCLARGIVRWLCVRVRARGR